MLLGARRGTLIVLSIFIFAAAAPPVGMEVVIKAGATLRVGEKVVDTGMSHSIYKVERVNGEWLWLVSGDIAGWAWEHDVLSLDQAIASYTAEIGRNAHAPWPYYNRGLIYQDRRNLDQALSDYSAAIRQDEKFVPALINRGNLWLVKRSVDRAIDDFSNAVKYDPKSILAHLNRGIALQAKGEYDKAIADYDEAISLGMKTAPTYNNRGHAREMKKDYDGAIADYDEAIRLDPDYRLAWMNRGSAEEAKKKYELALADFAQACRLDPKSPLGYARRAWILATCPEEKIRNGKEAVALAEQAVELAGSKNAYYAYYLDVRAAAHAEAGDFAKALFWENSAIAAVTNTSPPGTAEIYRGRLQHYRDNKPYRE